MKNNIRTIFCICLFAASVNLSAQTINVSGQATNIDNTTTIPTDPGYYIPAINSGGIIIESQVKAGVRDSVQSVSLLSLVAVVSNAEKVDIYWSSSSETNIAYYVIERSRDDVHYKQLLQCRAVGNSNTTKNYYAFDAAPLPNYTFYRLKQIDLNGQSKDGPLVRVRINGKGKASVYPNPFSEFIMMDMHTIPVTGMHYVLSDINGKKLQQDQINNIVNYIQVRGLPQGVYTLTVLKNDIEVQSFTVIKK